MNDFTEDFTVRPGIWDTKVKIADISQHRHTVIFPDDTKPSQLSFCNNCADPFTQSGACAHCGMPQAKPS